MKSEMDREFLVQLESLRFEVIVICRSLLWDKGMLEDAVQEVVLQAVKSSSRFNAGTDFRSWLRRVAANTVFNLNRKSRELRPLKSDAGEEGDVARELSLEQAYEAVLKDPARIVSSLGKELRRAVEQLNETERTVFLLRSICEMKYQEIAETLSLPLGTVMGSLWRARAKLRKALAECSHEV